jgi:hypothetical protein
MTKPIQLIICLPYFPGFYGSGLDAGLDYAEEQFVEYRTDSYPSTDTDNESSHPEYMRLNASELHDILWRVTDYSAAHFTIAADWCELFDSVASDALELPLGIKYESMTSPREYNFETDRLFGYLPLKTARALFAISKSEKHATLGRLVKERFTSRSGFISGYTNHLAEWLARPVKDWDHNELQTLLMAVFEIRGMPDGGKDRDLRIADEIEGALNEGNSFDNAWSNGVDWTKFEAEREELREEKRLEFEGENPDAPEPVYRCPLTIDMFTEYRPAGRA